MRNKTNIEKIINTSFPSKADGMIKFIRSLEPEQVEWVGLLMQRAHEQGKSESFSIYPNILFN
jgi:hypothetical protein